MGELIWLMIVGYSKVISIFVLLLLPFSFSVHLWMKGGVKRSLAKLILSIATGFIITTGLAVAAYITWMGLDLTPYPWLAIDLIKQSAPNFSLLLITTYAGGILLLISIYLYSSPINYKAKKIFGRARFANAFEIKKAGLYADTGIILGRAWGQTLRMPGFEGVLVTAPTGAGKTLCIALPNLLEWQGSGIFNDLKGELYNKTAHHRREQLNNACYRWAPADPTSATCFYNPFYYVSSNPKLRIRDLQLIAEVIIPAERIDGGFWYTSSRDVFMMIALYLFETKGMATLAEIHDISKQENFFTQLETIVAQNKIKEIVFYQNAHSLLGTDNDKTRKKHSKGFSLTGGIVF